MLSVTAVYLQTPVKMQTIASKL